MPATLPRRVCIVLLLGFATSLAAWLVSRPWDIHGWLIGAPFGRDFVNFWMAPRLVLAGQGATLTDLPAYGAAIKATFGLDHLPALLFVYPPHLLLFLLPFAAMPFVPAVVAWTALNLAALAWTTRLIAPASRWPVALVVCLSPPALVMVLYGHFGGFIALTSVVALLQSERRPWLAGLCLAVLTVKPQYAAALGLILLAGGRWRCLMFAGAATIALVGASVAAFGVDVWRDFLTITMPLQSAIIAEFRAAMIETSVSAYFAARLWGAPAAAAWAIQAAVALAAFVSGATVLRRRVGGADTVLVVLLSALVMQPYASHYDLAIVAPALTMVLLANGPVFPVVASVWILMPLARILFLLDCPVLGVLVPAALFASVAMLGAAGRSAKAHEADVALSAA